MEFHGTSYGLDCAMCGRGVLMTRTMLKTATDAVARGEDPAGVIRDLKRDVVPSIAGKGIAAAAAGRS